MRNASWTPHDRPSAVTTLPTLLVLGVIRKRHRHVEIEVTRSAASIHNMAGAAKRRLTRRARSPLPIPSVHINAATLHLSLSNEKERQVTVTVVNALNRTGRQPMHTLAAGIELSSFTEASVSQCGKRALAGAIADTHPTLCPIQHKLLQHSIFKYLVDLKHNQLYKEFQGESAAFVIGDIEEVNNFSQESIVGFARMLEMEYTAIMGNHLGHAPKLRLGLLVFQNGILQRARFIHGADIVDPDIEIFLRNIDNHHWEWYGRIIDPSDIVGWGSIPSSQSLSSDPRISPSLADQKHMSDGHSCAESDAAGVARRGYLHATYSKDTDIDSF
ncbi:unnamed protein product [Zymoseptoria tritici ST99CH_3D7]|uniref:Uncharacterized protein n=1 Tax=Zymoseptoria tritici (strain ST99CH_3D7) TaxID=1276538 RepID=A0A1X7RDJ6_ZYMT9|nr:unnamed protein product [Zymoseptoria tritici ST99CH_3D7]